jgi:hypothetical protein
MIKDLEKINLPHQAGKLRTKGCYIKPKTEINRRPQLLLIT